MFSDYEEVLPNTNIAPPVNFWKMLFLVGSWCKVCLLKWALLILYSVKWVGSVILKAHQTYQFLAMKTNCGLCKCSSKCSETHPRSPQLICWNCLFEVQFQTNQTCLLLADIAFRCYIFSSITSAQPQSQGCRSCSSSAAVGVGFWWRGSAASVASRSCWGRCTRRPGSDQAFWFRWFACFWYIEDIQYQSGKVLITPGKYLDSCQA